MIKTVNLTDSAEDYKNKIPEGSLVLCPKCLIARGFVTDEIRSNGFGGVRGTSGDLHNGGSPFNGNNRWCPECTSYLLWDGKPLGAGNEKYPARRYQATFIEPDTFVSYLVGYMMIGHQHIDPCSPIWQYWARRSS